MSEPTIQPEKPVQRETEALTNRRRSPSMNSTCCRTCFVTVVPTP